MNKLKESGLFGAGLAVVDTPELVLRYNACLEAIGVEPTKLATFSIDGIGWSPEVAEEKGKIKYISAGAANQFGIILTPDQKGLPIYTPFNSFDRAVMEKFFRHASRQVADITSATGLWLDFIHDLLDYQSPLDLLMVESVTVRAYDVGGLIKAAAEQRDLVRQFRTSETAWSDPAFRARMIAGAKERGDLRFRAMEVPDMPFTDLRCFYTRAFGGVYVFRDVLGKPLLILEDENHQPMSVHDAKVFMTDDDLASVLLANGLVETPLGWYKKNIDELEAVRTYAIVDAFYRDDKANAKNYGELTSAQQKQWLSANAKKLPVWFAEIGRLIAKLRNGDAVKGMEVSEGLSRVLMRPVKAVLESESASKVLMQLLARLDPSDVDRLFAYNRILFYDLYRSWPEGKKDWCIAHLKGRGHPRHMNADAKAKLNQQTKKGN